MLSEDVRETLPEIARQRHRAIVARAREDPIVFAVHVLRDEKTGKGIKPSPAQIKWHELISTHDRLILWAHVEAGKGLAVTTPIPTPAGWVTMGELRAGDVVFGGDGRAACVTFATDPQFGRPCYRVCFDDGTSLVTDDVHRWKVRSIDDVARARQNLGPSSAHVGNGDLCACGCGLQAKQGKRFVHNHHRVPQTDEHGWRVLNTTELLRAGLLRVSGAKRKDGERYAQYKWRTPLPGEVCYVMADLPIDPYWLGVWLGDGDSRGPAITLHEDDRSIAERCERVEGTAKWKHSKRNPHVLRVSFWGPRDRGKLRKRLSWLNVLCNKHIPRCYLTAHSDQRRALLAGLLDTDGTVSMPKGRVEFANMNAQLADDVAELARSLGFKVRVRSKEVFAEDGRMLGPAFTVSFGASYPVFALERKVALQRDATSGRARYRSITAIEPVPSVSTRCIAVDSPDNTYLAGRSYIVTHNSQHISIARPLWELGRKPNMRIAIGSKTKPLAQKIVRSCQQIIAGETHSAHAYREVFPHVRPAKDPSLPWTSLAITIERDTPAKDPSVQAFGNFGNIIGSRIDLLILDDVLDQTNTRTPAPRDALWDWVRSTLFGRLTDRARVVLIGNAWHPDDLMHRFEREPRFSGFRFPVLDSAGVPTWPERWSIERIEAAREDFGPLDYARQLFCQPRDDDSARFKREWVEAALARGVGLNFLATRADVLEELTDPATAALYRLGRVLADDKVRIYTGVDLAVQQHAAADLSSFVTIAALPDGTRRLCSIESGRWGAPEILARIEQHDQRYQPIFVVENVGAQDYIVQLVRATSAIPVIPYTTGRTKAHPEFGVEGIAAELAAAKWIFPNAGVGDGRGPKMHRETFALVQDLLSYDPRSHTGDRLMALFFAREGARSTEARLGSGRARATVISTKGEDPKPAPVAEKPTTTPAASSDTIGMSWEDWTRKT